MTKKFLPIILISCLGIIAYSNTFHCSFQFDDRTSILDNSNIRNITNLQGIWNFWPGRFLTYLSIAFNFHFNGLNVFGYHLFNLGVHLISAILVWWLTRLTLLTPAMKKDAIGGHANCIALFAGLVFVAHPIQTQAVTYIVQRAASMATLFYLASICFYVKFRFSVKRPNSIDIEEVSSNVIASETKPRHGGPHNDMTKLYYMGALVMTIMAMFTKETAITLPLMILLYEFSFLETKNSLNWRYVAPFLLAILIIPLTMLFTQYVNFQEMRRTIEPPSGISSIQYLLTQFRVVVTYIRLAFFPFNQNLDYDYPIFKSLFEWPVLLSLCFLTAILIFAKNLFLKYRVVSFSIFWFFLTLMPESSFLPIKDVIFEHRLYLPLAGYSIFLVSSLYYILGEKSFRAMIMVLIVIISCYAVLTYQRNKIWKDQFTLWSDAVQKSPHKARPYYSRGLSYIKQDDARAIADYNKAIELDPNFPEVYYARGLSYVKLGDFTRATADFNKAIEINPDYADAYNNRGIIYGRQGNFIKAISDLNWAIEINPDDADAYCNRGNIYLQQGNIAQAIGDYSKAIEINPDDAQAYSNLGLIYYSENKCDIAWNNVNKAKELGAVVNPEFIAILIKCKSH